MPKQSGMVTRGIRRTVLPAVAVALAALASPGTAATLTPELRVTYTGGTELAYDGERYVFAGQRNGRVQRDELPKQGGVRILDTSVSPPRLAGTIACPGTDMDVAVVRPGLLAVGYHRSACGPVNGVTFFDVSNPAKPRRLGSVAVPSAHTLTALPGTSYVYVSPGGLGNGRGRSAIVDASDPARPRVARTYTPSFWGCHDVTFQQTPLHGLLGVCTGGRGVELWDMSDPLVPRLLSRPDSEQVQFPHGAAVSPDGLLLVVNDEAFAGHGCGDTATVAGSLFLYDILDPERPELIGAIKPPRGDRPYSGYGVDSWCTSHQLNFAPVGRTLVNAWFTGGTSVWDLTVPARPREVAYYRPNDAITWTAHSFADRIWVNDLSRGLEVLRLSQLPAGPVGVSPAWVPAALLPPPAPRPPLPRDSRYVCPV